jgi:hypothetical protein
MGYLATPQGSGRATSSTYTTGLGILLTGTTINNKGAYVDVYTASDPIGYLIVELQPAGVAGAQALVDIVYTTLGAGQEHILAANLGVNSGTGFTTHSIRARYQRSNASLTMRCAIKGFANTDVPYRGRIQTLGATTGTSRGTSVDPGGSANAKGSYSQLVAATDAPINWMLLHIGNQSNTARTDAQYVVDVAVGTDVKVANLQFSMDDTADEPGTPYIGPFPISIPQGSQVQVRGACTITDATDRTFDVIAYGIA